MAMNNGFDREVRFEIVEQIGVLSGHSTGWNKELNLVSWNGGQPKYDIRDWDMNHQRMSRGVTLHENEMRQIFDLMKKRRMVNRMKREGGEYRSEEPFDAPQSYDGSSQSRSVDSCTGESPSRPTDSYTGSSQPPNSDAGNYQSQPPQSKPGVSQVSSSQSRSAQSQQSPFEQDESLICDMAGNDSALDMAGSEEACDMAGSGRECDMSELEAGEKL